jgi:hypothetical protein
MSGWEGVYTIPDFHMCLGEAQGVRCGADLGIPNRDRCAAPVARALGSTMAAENAPPSAGEEHLGRLLSTLSEGEWISFRHEVTILCLRGALQPGSMSLR